MALSDINLGANEVLLIQGASTSGLISTDNKTQFGVVEKISDLCNGFVVGAYVMYDPTKGRSLMYGSTMYILITEENISGTEPTPV